MEDKELDFMIQEITMGIPREESHVRMTPEAIETWDTLTEEIAAIKAAGMQVDIPFDTPSVDVVNPKLIVQVEDPEV